MKLTRFEDLQRWQETRKLVNMVYDAIRQNQSFQSDYRLKEQGTGGIYQYFSLENWIIRR